MASHDESLVLELLGDISWAGARNLDPGLGEDGAGDEHIGDVDGGVDGVQESLSEVQWGGHVVCDTGSSEELGRALLGLPDTEKTDEKVLREARVEHLGDEEDVGGEGGLQHNGHVRGVEEADGVGSASTTLAGRLDWDLDTETLEVDDSGENEEGREQVHDVGEVLAVERLLESALLVVPGKEEVEQGNDGTLELRATASVDGGGRERLPDDRLANVGSNEERDTASESVSLLEKLIEEDNNKTSHNQLEDEEEDNTSAEIRWLSVEASEDIHGGLSHREDNSEELLSGLVQLAVGLQVKVDIDEVGASKELEYHAGRDNWRDTQFHQRSSVTRQHHAQPVKWIGGI